MAGSAPWVCFHCGTRCETEHEAEQHFGTSTDARLPRCFAFGEAWVSALECVRLARREMRAGSTDVVSERLTKAEALLMEPRRY